MKIVEVKNIGKKYTITHHKGGYVTLRDTIVNAFKHPFRSLKKTFGIGTKEEFWALKNINFEVNKGEIIGIIGHNGAGKSTLLKILSRITPPSTGEIHIQGTVGSLLEVGTGFHPELSGRENIFLNGAILGMKKKDIIATFDKIVEFAGIERFMDTPVKYYSSGMYVRLAFSVAAHMDPDILIIDEVLAVGDEEFQKKCLGKMEEVTKKDGRTILFVSHDMHAIKQLCTKTLWIDKGEIKMSGPTQDVVQAYTNEYQTFTESNEKVTLPKTNQFKELVFKKVWASDEKGNVVNTLPHTEDFIIRIEFDVVSDINFVEISLTFKNTNGVNVLSTSLSDCFGGKTREFKKGTYIVSARIQKNFLLPDTYSIRLAAHEKGVRDIDVQENALRFKIHDAGSTMASYGLAATQWSTVLSDTQWMIEE